MTQGNLQIHTENILPIIKKWLYTDKEIFVRELVSNACDALRKVQILRENKKTDVADAELCIEILSDTKAKTLTFVDSGIGMTAAEVEKYIAQIAFSGAEEFVKQYEGNHEIIGHFGLGFYSAYMAADRVVIDTLSYQEGAVAALWDCAGGSEYTLNTGTRTSRGTAICLYINAESEEFLEETRLREILSKYCAFLPFPIRLNGKAINEKQPLWLKAPSACTDEEYLDFYHTLYPGVADPMSWIHLNVDYPFHLKGILYLPKITKRFDWTQNNIKLFSNRVFVSDSCKDLLPDFLLSLQGAIDSPDIPLNVSRSTLQMDRTVKQLATHISKKIADRFTNLYQNEKEKYIAGWTDVEIIIKLGMLQDDKFFERAKEFAIFKTAKDDYLLLDQLPEKLFYTVDPTSPLLALYQEQTVLISTSPIDTALFSLLESKTTHRFQRIDGGLDSSILDTSRESTLLDAEGKTESGRIADFFRATFAGEPTKMDIEAKSLASESLPAFLIVDEQMRRLREAYAFSEQGFPLPQKRTFVINTNNPIIQHLLKLKTKQPELAETIAKHLFDLSLLTQKELQPADLTQFVSRSTGVIEKLLEQNAGK